MISITELFSNTYILLYTSFVRLFLGGDHMLHSLPRFSFVLIKIKTEKGACTKKFQLLKDYSNAAYLALLS